MENANIIENEEELELRGIENVSEDKILYSVKKEIGVNLRLMPIKILARAIDVGNGDVCMEIDIPMDEFPFKDKKFTFFRVSYNFKKEIFGVKTKIFEDLYEYFKSLLKKEEVSAQEQKGLEVDGFNVESILKNYNDFFGKQVDFKDIKFKSDVIFLKINYKQIENNEIKLSFVDEDKKYSLELGTAQTKIDDEEKDYFMKISNKLSLNELQPFIRKDKYEQLKTESMLIECKKKQAEFSEINKKYEKMLIEYKKKQAELSEKIKFFSKKEEEIETVFDAAKGNLNKHNEEINFLAEEVDTCKGFLITMIDSLGGKTNDLRQTSEAGLIIERAQEVLDNNKNNLNKNMNSELNNLKADVEKLKNEKKQLNKQVTALQELNKQLTEKANKIAKLEKQLVEKTKKVEELKKVIKDEKLKTYVGELINENERLKDQALGLDETIKHLKKQLDEKVKKIDELEKQLEEETKKVEELEKKSD